jgi:hypothetical protein
MRDVPDRVKRAMDCDTNQPPGRAIV